MEITANYILTEELEQNYDIFKKSGKNNKKVKIRIIEW